LPARRAPSRLAIRRQASCAPLPTTMLKGILGWFLLTTSFFVQVVPTVATCCVCGRPAHPGRSRRYGRKRSAGRTQHDGLRGSLARSPSPASSDRREPCAYVPCRPSDTAQDPHGRTVGVLLSLAVAPDGRHLIDQGGLGREVLQTATTGRGSRSTVPCHRWQPVPRPDGQTRGWLGRGTGTPRSPSVRRSLERASVRHRCRGVSARRRGGTAPVHAGTRVDGDERERQPTTRYTAARSAELMWTVTCSDPAIRRAPSTRARAGRSSARGSRSGSSRARRRGCGRR
jgi:hypothetical protein